LQKVIRQRFIKVVRHGEFALSQTIGAECDRFFVFFKNSDEKRVWS
jgi:hypothetical protein